MKIEDVFNIKNSNSKGFSSHKPGDTYFISNGMKNNGILGLVKPLPNERVFYKEGICVSAFCEATVQKPPFLPRGNGGSGLIVLLPKEEISEEELYWYSSCINQMKWRFSFGRMVTRERIKNLNIQKIPNNFKIDCSVENLLPKNIKNKKLSDVKFKLYPIKDLFKIIKGKGEYFEKCRKGNTPLISATSTDNGIIGFVDLKPIFRAPAISIERVSGNSFVHLEDFVTVPDDIFVLIPKKIFPIELFFYVSSMLNSQKWRFNYSRKLTPNRFKKLKIPMPFNKKGINLNYIKDIVDFTYGWDKVPLM